MAAPLRSSSSAQGPKPQVAEACFRPPSLSACCHQRGPLKPRPRARPPPAPQVSACLPSERSPTVSQLEEEGFVAVEVIVEERQVRAAGRLGGK